MAKKAAVQTVEIIEEEKELNKVYVQLNQLQSIVAKKFEIEAKKEEIPRDLEDKKALLLKTNTSYLELHEKSEKIKEEIKSLSEKLREAEETRESDEKKMETITLSREFDTLTKQIEVDKDTEAALRKNLISKRNYSEELNTKLSIQEEMINAQEEEVREEENRMNVLFEECNAQEAECDALINEKSEGISNRIMSKFERIIRNKHGVGIVPIHGIECMGCHMTLPAQFVNDVREVTFKEELDEEEIKFCPYCSRVLYYENATGEDVISDVPESDDSDEADDTNEFAEAVGGNFSLD